MKKSILLIAMLTVLTTAFAQGESAFNIKHRWYKTVGYTYQPGYPYGFSVFGSTFISVGFAGENMKYPISATDYREPTWSMRFGWVGYTFDKKVTGWGAVSFRPYVNMGMDFAKIYTANESGGQDIKNTTYFTFAPTLEVNVYMLHFSIGYEIVPKFTDINGINFGVGFSIPSTTK